MKNLILLLSLVLLHLASKAQTNLYVDSSVTVSGNGTTWATAYKTLNAALNYANLASSSTNYTIHIARGTYYPTGVQNLSFFRDSAFAIVRGGVKLLGGYPNGGGARDHLNLRTTLSGDIGVPGDSTDNCYHVLVVAGLNAADDSVIVDGLTITKGNADGGFLTKTYNGIPCDKNRGGGIHSNQTDTKLNLRNVIITSCYASFWGGGMYNNYSWSNISNCTFTLNRASVGGAALHGTAATPAWPVLGMCVTDCSFASNSIGNANGAGTMYVTGMALYTSRCTFSSNSGCALYFYSTQTLLTLDTCTISACRFLNNSGTATLPGAIYVGTSVNISTSNSSTILDDTFVNNTGSSGGAILLSATMFISRSLFTGNSAASGGAIYLDAGYIYKCKFDHNSATGNGGAIFCNAFYTAPINSCFFTANKCAGAGGAVFGFWGVQLSNDTMVNDTAGISGGAVSNNGRCNIENCIIYQNHAPYGGGIHLNANTNNFIMHCKISGNTATMNGGGIYANFNSPYFLAEQNLITGNSAAQNGGGCYIRNAASGYFINHTFAGNLATNGAAIYDSMSSPNFVNSIIYNGIAGIFNTAGSNPNITYSLIQGGYPGAGNISIDPLFASPVPASSAPSVSGNYKPVFCSPAINAGLNNVPNTGNDDVDHLPRHVDVAVDMGAHEYQGILQGISPITGSNTVCTNDTIHLQNFSAGGVWSGSNPAIATVNSLGVVQGVSPGSATITFSVSLCAASVTKTITVLAAPVVAAITGANAVCVSGTLQLANATSNGSWSSGSNANATISPSGLVTGVAAGTDTVFYTVSNAAGCIGLAYTVVTVHPSPTVGSIVGPATVCTGSNIQMTDTSLGGIWSSDNSGVATVSGSGLVQGVAPGSANILYTITGANGCSSSAMVNVIVNSVDITVSQNLNTLTAFQAGANYQWITCPSNAILPGETGQSFTATANGQYAAIITYNGCTDTSACFNISQVSVSHAQVNLESLEVYPNPAQDHITVNTGNTVADKINILDITGRELSSFTPMAPTTYISLSGYSSGTYQVVIYKDGNKQMRKITVY